MHVSTFFQISHNNPKLDIFAALKDNAKIAKFKKLLTSNILATDMVEYLLIVTTQMSIISIYFLDLNMK